MNKQIIKKIKIPIIINLIILTFIFVDDRLSYFGKSFGQIIAKYYPCPVVPNEDVANSIVFPCWQKYDMALLFSLIVIFIFISLIAVIQIILFVRANKKL